MTTLLDKNIGLAEYIWLDINGNYRQKTCALKNKIHDLKDFKIWNFDGSSTGQALGHDSEIYLIFKRIMNVCKKSRCKGMQISHLSELEKC